MKVLLIGLLLSGSFTSMAQKVSLRNEPADLMTPILNKPLFSDSLSSSFLIVVKQEVKLHKHMDHSEHVYVMEGEADMRLGAQSFHIVPGDLIFIPKGAAHSVKVTSSLPLKVVSVQSPMFDGKDRVMLE